MHFHKWRRLIVAKAERAIEQITIKKGLDAILDSSVFDAVLFADESKDLMEDIERVFRLR